MVIGRKSGVLPARMGFGAITGQIVGTRVGAKKERKTRRLTVTMGTLVPKVQTEQ
jgi:hypothetical protein